MEKHEHDAAVGGDENQSERRLGRTLPKKEKGRENRVSSGISRNSRMFFWEIIYWYTALFSPRDLKRWTMNPSASVKKMRDEGFVLITGFVSL